MIDYSKMSDFDISKRVLISLGYKPAYEDESCISFLSSNERKDVGDGGVKRFKFDPCNNPADAWPIIVANLIEVSPDYLFTDDSEEELCATGFWMASHVEADGKSYYQVHQNPLRAAMIVFLMLKDAEKC